jgi:hypothetical protein
MTSTNINIRKEANLTSYGKCHNGNCEPVVCIELHKTFNSLKDTADFFGVDYQRIWGVLNGTCNTIGLWERDENGKRIRRICKCHLEYARNIEAAQDKLMAHGRQMMVDNAAIKRENSDLRKENENLNAQLIEKDNLRITLKQLFEEKEMLEREKIAVARREATIAELESRLALMV